MMKGGEMALRIGCTISNAPQAASAGSAEVWFSTPTARNPTNDAQKRKRRGNRIEKPKSQPGGIFHGPIWQTTGQSLKQPIRADHNTNGAMVPLALTTRVQLSAVVHDQLMEGRPASLQARPNDQDTRTKTGQLITSHNVCNIK